MRRAQKPLQLTAPGGPAGWPMSRTGPSFDEALDVLSRGTGEPCYVLGIDQADRSGWAVHDLERVVLSGVATSCLERGHVLDQLAALPGFLFVRLLVFYEDHGSLPATYRQTYDHATGEAPTRGPRVAIGLGDARGRWQEQLDLRCHPIAQRVLVPMVEWRQVIGSPRSYGASTWKQAALRWASATAGREITDDDEAEARAIATYGARKGLHDWAERRLRARAAARRRA